MIEFTIEREVFLKGVQKTLGIVERKATLPIMANVLIEAVLPCGGGGLIRLEATDMELRLSVEYPASVIKEGRITVPAKKIYEAVRELAGETLHLVEGAAATVIMTSNKAVCNLRGLAADDFPAFPEADAAAGDSVFFGIKSALLRKLIGLVYASISTDEQRKALTGVFLERDPDLVRTLVRMALCAKIGPDRIAKCGKVIHKDGDMRLIAIKGYDVQILRVRCPSTKQLYFLRVPRDAKECEEARQWTFGVGDGIPAAINFEKET